MSAPVNTPVRTYVLVITDRHFDRVWRKAVRAYDSADAAHRFRAMTYLPWTDGLEPTEILRDVEPYEPERRPDHRTAERLDGIEAPS